MTGQIRSLCFARGLVDPADYTKGYTVPPGFVLLFKSLTVNNDNQAPAVLHVAFYAAGSPDGIQLVRVDLAAATTWNWNGWIALNGEDSININCESQRLGYWMSGALLPYFVTVP